MDICVTKKLLDAMPFNVTAESEEEVNPLYSWHANVIIINRRKTIILMNDSTRYTVVLHGLMAKEMKRLDELIIEAIRETLQAERVREDVIELYLKEAGKVRFHKTKNRTMVARLNKACENVLWFDDEFDSEEMIQAAMVKNSNRVLVGAAKTPYTQPHEEMFKELATLAGDESVFTDKVAVLYITLALENHSIWRRVVVPLDYSFYDLHKVIQTLFDWDNMHLHEFNVYDKTVTSSISASRKPELTIIMDSKMLGFDLDSEGELETKLSLSDVLKENQHIRYIYDFGDDWIHDIKVEELTTDSTIRPPVCMAGEGTAPPEDSGGEPGYEEYLRIMADPKDELHQAMQEWTQAIRHRDFNMRMVNYELKLL